MSREKIEERSAGAVLFYNDNGVRKYLLLKHRRGHWDLPKGNIEAGEDPFDTAKRELVEETGIKNVRFYDGYREVIEYYYRRRGGILVHKVVVFFLAEALSNNVRISAEHVDYKWVDYASAIELATYKNTKKLLAKAEDFLMNNSRDRGSNNSFP